MIQIDPRNSSPIYEQIIKQMKELCLKGILKPGEKVPSVRELSSMIVANPNTVSKAYKELEREGVIETLRGRGTFVTETVQIKMNEEKVEMLKEQLKSIVVDAYYAGIKIDDIQNWIKEIEKEIGGKR
ncbi:GntR family transcriptional regulator [Bacillus suaedaesalsae]|uniref:GntR family transcriptional regulator n=1 Tax=Bacillus suaedaesalsae TaxID=2810349 RepID=A0ABS2DHS9_9BACI|nr:GntR family transcriptional regulator [Bacillus suaedaesalsae]